MCHSAISLYEDLLCKISVSGSLQQDPLGPLAVYQDLLCKMSVSGSLGRNPV